jgi:hypothetical protein
MVIGEIAGRRLTPLECLRLTLRAMSRHLSLLTEAKPRFDILLAVIALHPRTT